MQWAPKRKKAKKLTNVKIMSARYGKVKVQEKKWKCSCVFGKKKVIFSFNFWGIYFFNQKKVNECRVGKSIKENGKEKRVREQRKRTKREREKVDKWSGFSANFFIGPNGVVTQQFGGSPCAWRSNWQAQTMYQCRCW